MNLNRIKMKTHEVYNKRRLLVFLFLIFSVSYTFSQTKYFDEIPTGSTIILNKKVIIPANSSSVFLGDVTYTANNKEYSISITFNTKRTTNGGFLTQNDNTVDYERVLNIGKEFKTASSVKMYDDQFNSFTISCTDGSSFSFKNKGILYKPELDAFILNAKSIISIIVKNTTPQDY